MKIAIGLRTCGTVYDYWGIKRIVDADKPTIMFTCLNSLIKSIKASKHDIVLSIHDDNSTNEQRQQMEKMVSDLNCKFYSTEAKGNFKSQYHWIKEQDCDYVYMVEDDYLHIESAIDDMIDMCEYMKVFWPGEYAIFPMNHPQRYHSPEAMNPSYVAKGPKGYWRSAFHTTSTFFMSKKAADDNDDILRQQAYMWEIDGAPEDRNINKLWQKQEVRLMYPIESLAWHLSDEWNRDPFGPWEKVWSENETR